MKIAFIQTGRLGDCILATTIIPKIRNLYPDAEIHWHIFKSFADVAKMNPHIDKVQAWDDKGGFDTMILWERIPVYCAANYDKVFNPQVYPYVDWTKRPGVCLLQQMTEKAGFQYEKPKLRLRYGGIGSKERFGAEAGQRLITLNYQSVSQNPLWSDGDVKKIQSLLGDDYHVAVGEQCNHSLKDWCTAIASSDMYVGPDSGGTWIAASTDVPQVVTYRSDYPRWLTGLHENVEKDPSLVAYFVDPSVDAVAQFIKSHFEGTNNALDCSGQGEVEEAE